MEHVRVHGSDIQEGKENFFFEVDMASKISNPPSRMPKNEKKRYI